jgi:hypothetical protein
LVILFVVIYTIFRLVAEFTVLLFVQLTVNSRVILFFEYTAPSILRIDNQSTISVAKHPEHHGRMKQLDLSWYWLRDVVHREIIAPTFVPTTEQPADILTKALA